MPSYMQPGSLKVPVEQRTDGIADARPAASCFATFQAYPDMNASNPTATDGDNIRAGILWMLVASAGGTGTHRDRSIRNGKSDN